MPPPQLIKTQALAPLQLSRNDLHEMAVGYAVGVFDRKGQCEPTWIVAAAGKLMWFETAWGCEHEKHLHVECMYRLMQALNADAYAFLSEMWCASYRDGDPQVPPSERPVNERDDILVITTFDRSGEFEATRFKVTIRQPVGPNFLGPRDDETMKHLRVGGDLWNLLQ